MALSTIDVTIMKAISDNIVTADVVVKNATTWQSLFFASSNGPRRLFWEEEDDLAVKCGRIFFPWTPAASFSGDFRTTRESYWLSIV